MRIQSFDDLGRRLAATSFPRPLRRCQQLALDSFEQARASGRQHIHLVLPPGSGKTVLGLEISRRLGKPTMVLCPNTAIQAQWGQQWQEFQPGLVTPSLDSTDLAPLTLLT